MCLKTLVVVFIGEPNAEHGVTEDRNKTKLRYIITESDAPTARVDQMMISSLAEVR